MSEALELLRRHLRQRRALGEQDLVLDGLTPEALLQLIGRATHGEPETPVAPSSAEPGGPAAPALTPRERAADAPAPGPTSPEIVELGGLAELRATALGCPRCGLARTRRQVVFGEGNENAEVLVVGEAPGAEEDRSGRPFVGRAGKLLDLLLASVGFPRESVYICNVLKCRPPGNRNPEPEEIEACSPYLRRQVELIGPRVILTVGTFPTQTLLGSPEPISRLRGRVHEYMGTPLIPTFHPAAVLRNPGWIRPVWEDLQRLRELLDGDTDGA